MSRCSAHTDPSSRLSRYQNPEAYVSIPKHTVFSILKLNHISQVVELDHGYRERVHNYQLHTYMYGQIIQAPPGISSATLGGEALTDLVLSPSSTVINFDDLSIFRIGAG